MPLVVREMVAIALTVVFYVLAVAISAGLIAYPVGELAAGESPGPALIALPAMALTILAQLVPPRAPFVAPGPRLTRDAQPEFVGLVEEVARAAGHPPPDAMYLIADVNAGVFEMRSEGGSRERVLLIGLPLLEVLTVDQLRAILAHEFGHYVAHDTRVSQWTYHTRLALLRVASIEWRAFEPVIAGIVRWPFRLYTSLFLRISSAIARRQELAADVLAARIAGTDAQVGALRRTAACAPAFDGYWEGEFMPALRRGLRPPLGEGFREFLSAERISEAVHRALDSALEQDRHDPYDSHPSLRQRLAALGAGPDDDRPDDGPRAPSLLRGHADLEEQLVRGLIADAFELRAATWEDIEQDWLRRYAVMVDARRPALQGRRVGEVALLAADPAPLVSGLRAMWPDAFGEDGEALARELLAAALTVALVRDGFEFHARPGEPLTCSRDGHRFTPFIDVTEIAGRPYVARMLEDRLAAAGVSGAPLVEALHEAAPVDGEDAGPPLVIRPPGRDDGVLPVSRPRRPAGITERSLRTTARVVCELYRLFIAGFLGLTIVMLILTFLPGPGWIVSSYVAGVPIEVFGPAVLVAAALGAACSVAAASTRSGTRGWSGRTRSSGPAPVDRARSAVTRRPASWGSALTRPTSAAARSVAVRAGRG